MAQNNEVDRIQRLLLSAIPLIEKIETKRGDGHVLLSLICIDEPLYGVVAFKLNAILRKIDKQKHLNVLIESPGGDIDTAYKIAKLFKQHSKDQKFTVIVPFYAKSAASLIALNASEIILPPSGELGPIDPQVTHPTMKEFFIPAHSIRDALRFIEQTSDPFVKLTMADKLDPLMIGAYEHSQTASVQYVSESLQSLEDGKRGEAIKLFTQELKSHGYPITKDLLNKKGFNSVCDSLGADEELEELACDLHAAYMDALLEHKVNRALIIQTKEFAYTMIDGEVMSFPFKSDTEKIEGVEKTSLRIKKWQEK